VSFSPRAGRQRSHERVVCVCCARGVHSLLRVVHAHTAARGEGWKVVSGPRGGSAGSGSEPRFEQSRGAQAIISTTASGLSLATAAAQGELSLGGAGVHIRPRFLGNGAQRERILHHLALDGGHLVCACADLLISLSSSGHPPTTTTNRQERLPEGAQGSLCTGCQTMIHTICPQSN
jgi:hypothetical protein